jgi:GxxExxY protein
MNTDGDRDPLTSSILKGCFAVANELGYGLAEPIYQRALAIELTSIGLAVSREVRFPVCYRGNDIGVYVADFIVDDEVVLELKALHGPLQPAHTGQCLNYMRLAKLPTGLVINFGRPRLEWKRLKL